MTDLPELPVEVIRRLLVACQGTPVESRLQALLYLATHPEARRADAARHAGISERSLRRFVERMRNGGLEAVIYNGRLARKLSPDSLIRLYEWVRNNPASSLREVCEWVEDHFDVSYTEGGMRKLLGEEFKVTRGFVLPDGRSTSSTIEKPDSPFARGSARLVRFLNLLPVSMVHGEWMVQTRGALKELFPQADITHVLLRPHVDLAVRREGSPRSAFISQATTTPDERTESPSMHVADRNYTTLEERVLSMLMESHNSSIEDFHPPVVFPLYIHGDIHFALITFLISRRKPDTGDQIRAELEKLRPFLTFLFSDGVAREQLSHPARMAIKSAIDELRERYGLSAREYQVLTLYLFSDSYDSIAEELKISPETVSSHIKRIRAKTGLSSRGELMRAVGFPSTDSPTR